MSLNYHLAYIILLLFFIIEKLYFLWCILWLTININIQNIENIYLQNILIVVRKFQFRLHNLLHY